jgi:F-type H+/Na+-transporting ATPase subunit alpha
MRQVAGKLRLDLAQYRELAAFAQFSSDLDKATRDQLTRGRAVTEVLKQPQFQPLPVEKQVAIIWAATNGHLDDVEPTRIGEFETGFYRFLESTHDELLPAIAEKKALDDELSAALEKAVAEFKRQGGYGKADDGADAKAPANAEADSDGPEADADGPKAEADAPKADAEAPEADEGREPEAAAEATEDGPRPEESTARRADA